MQRLYFFAPAFNQKVNHNLTCIFQMFFLT